jgi:hypothetical protein
MRTNDTRPQSRSRWIAPALLVGACFGAIAGAVSGCQISGIVWDFGSRCAPGGAVAGALLGMALAAFALPALKVDARLIDRGRRVTATALLGVMAATGLALLVQSWATSEPGLDQIIPFVATLAAFPALACLLALMNGVLHGRAWATWLCIVCGGLTTVTGASSLAGSLSRTIPHGLKESAAAGWPAAMATVASVSLLWVLAGTPRPGTGDERPERRSARHT